MFKIQQYILYGISFTVFLGLLMKWSYDIWVVIDVLIVIITFFLAISLNEQKWSFNTMPIKMKIHSFIKKYKKAVLIVVGILAFLLIISVGNELNNQYVEWDKKQCEFAFTDVKQARYDFDRVQSILPAYCTGDWWADVIERGWSECYPKAEEHMTYIEIEGLLKNESGYMQKLESVVGKAYTDFEPKILLGESGKTYRKILSSGESLPFKISIPINRMNENISKYYDLNSEALIDYYPYFSSCDY